MDGDNVRRRYGHVSIWSPLPCLCARHNVSPPSLKKASDGPPLTRIVCAREFRPSHTHPSHPRLALALICKPTVPL